MLDPETQKKIEENNKQISSLLQENEMLLRQAGFDPPMTNVVLPQEKLIQFPNGYIRRTTEFSSRYHLTSIFANRHAVILAIRELNQIGIEDSIVIGFDLLTDRVKKIKNADIVAAFSDEDGAIPLQRAVRYTDDPNAPEMRVNLRLPPLRYADLQREVKEKKPSIKFGKSYYAALKKIKADKRYCQSNYLDPDNKSSSKKDFYTPEAIDALIAEYDQLEVTM